MIFTLSEGHGHTGRDFSLTKMNFSDTSDVSTPLHTVPVTRF